MNPGCALISSAAFDCGWSGTGGGSGNLLNPRIAGVEASDIWLGKLPAAAVDVSGKISAAWTSGTSIVVAESKEGAGSGLGSGGGVRRAELGKGLVDVGTSAVARVERPLPLPLLDRGAAEGRRGGSLRSEPPEGLDMEDRLDLRHPPPTGTLRRTPPLVQ